MALRERFNAISHMVGAGIALVALPWLAVDAEGGVAIASAVVYGASLGLLFTMSVLFHSLHGPRATRWLFRLDQSAIYLLIAGTYTPLGIVLVGGIWGWALVGVEWVLAITGITVLLTLHRTPQWVHQAAYIMLGWAAVIVLPNLQDVPVLGIGLVFAGGVAYTGGAMLYWRDRPGTLGIGDHGLWHLLVLSGSLAHLAFVLGYVL